MPVVGRSKYRYRDLIRPGTVLCAQSWGCSDLKDTGTFGVQKGRESSTDMLPRSDSISSTLIYLRCLVLKRNQHLRTNENSQTSLAFNVGRFQ